MSQQAQAGDSRNSNPMTDNTNLKRRAREFAKSYDLSYATALRAVDEPLHGLRDFLVEVEAQSDSNLRLQFRLHGEQGIFSDAFLVHQRPHPHKYSPVWARAGLTYGEVMPPIPSIPTLRGSDLERNVRDRESFPTIDEDEFIIELGQRAALLRKHAVRSIWELRALQRAGIIDRSMDLSLRRHYYGTKIEAAYMPAMKVGASLGIFTVAMGNYTDLQTAKQQLIPISPVTLDNLFAGGSGISPDFGFAKRGLPKTGETIYFPDGLQLYETMRDPHMQDNRIFVYAAPGIDLKGALFNHGLDSEGFVPSSRYEESRPSWIARRGSKGTDLVHLSWPTADSPEKHEISDESKIQIPLTLDSEGRAIVHMGINRTIILS